MYPLSEFAMEFLKYDVNRHTILQKTVGSHINRRPSHS
jgi:hypothetical protein